MHQFSTRVYYEDTDAGGVVFYANYLKFAERARTEWLRELGFNQSKLRETNGILFVVRSCKADYLRPAKLDDELLIRTHLQEMGKARMSMQQEVFRASDQTHLTSIQVVLVRVDSNGKPTAIPDSIRTKMNHG